MGPDDTLAKGTIILVRIFQSALATKAEKDTALSIRQLQSQEMQETFRQGRACHDTQI